MTLKLFTEFLTEPGGEIHLEHTGKSWTWLTIHYCDSYPDEHAPICVEATELNIVIERVLCN